MKVLVVAAHPDDEALGCGGTIARHTDENDEVHVLFIADGESSRANVSRETIGVRQQRAQEACGRLGTKPPIFLGLQDNQLDSLPLLQVVQAVEAHIHHLRPDLIYTHNGGDLNIDHRITHQAVMTACRPQPESTVKAIYSFEVPSSTEWSSVASDKYFRPNRFIDISRYLKTKMDVLKCYDKEMRAFPHSRSMEGVAALARWRGVSVGLIAAEAFMVEREII